MSNWSEHDVLSEAWLHLSLHDLMATVQSWGECWHQKRYLDTFLQIRISFWNNSCLGFFFAWFFTCPSRDPQAQNTWLVNTGPSVSPCGDFFHYYFCPKKSILQNSKKSEKSPIVYGFTMKNLTLTLGLKKFLTSPHYYWLKNMWHWMWRSFLKWDFRKVSKMRPLANFSQHVPLWKMS